MQPESSASSPLLAVARIPPITLSHSASLSVRISFFSSSRLAKISGIGVETPAFKHTQATDDGEKYKDRWS